MVLPPRVVTVKDVALILSLDLRDGGALAAVDEPEPGRCTSDQPGHSCVEDRQSLPQGTIGESPVPERLDAVAALVAKSSRRSHADGLVVTFPDAANSALGIVSAGADLSGWAVADSLSGLTGLPCAILNASAARAHAAWMTTKSRRLLAIDFDHTRSTITYLIDGRGATPEEGAVMDGMISSSDTLSEWLTLPVADLMTAVPKLHRPSGSPAPWRSVLRAARSGPGPAREAFAAAGKSWAEAIALLAAQFSPDEITFTGPGAAAFDVLFPGYDPHSSVGEMRLYSDGRTLHVGAAGWMRHRLGE